MIALRYIRLVLWSFFGVRRRASAAQEMGEVRPLPLVVTAIVLALAFVGLLVWLASVAAGTLD